jgi:hypothetical protein
MPWFFFPVAFLQIGLAGNSIPSPEVSSFDDGGRDETNFDLLLLPDDFGRSRALPDRESNTCILHCAEFLDQELHGR